MESESEVPPPSLYANSQSKERTILLKKMAQKQKNKEASNKKSKSVPTTSPAKFDEKSIDALKKEIGATCDCVAEIAVTIESIGERIKTDIGALENEFDSKLVVINETINKQAQTQLNMEVAITELYKKVHFIEQILITSEDRNNLELELIASTSIKDEMITQNKEAIKTNFPILIPPDNLEQVPPSTSQKDEAVPPPPPTPHPQSITVDDVKPKIDNNLVVLDTGSAQSAGSYSFRINYDL